MRLGVALALLACADASRVVEVVTTTTSSDSGRGDWLSGLWLALVALVMLSMLACVLSPFLGRASEQLDDQPTPAYVPAGWDDDEPPKKPQGRALSTRIISRA